MARRRTMRDTALRAVAWRHPYVVLAWPVVKWGGIVLVAWVGGRWLWSTVSHTALAAIVFGAAGLAGVAVTVYVRTAEARRPVLTWALAAAGTVLLVGAAYSALGGAS